MRKVLMVAVLLFGSMIPRCAVLLEVEPLIGESRSQKSNKVYVCHKGKKTLHISRSALQAHLNHGDYEGPCR